MRRPSTPLLRVAAASASASCSTVASAPDDVEPVDHADARIHLRGVVTGQEGDVQTIEVATPAGSKRIELPVDGPWPRPFHITEADLDGLAGAGDDVDVTVTRQNGMSHTRSTVTLPRRASALVLTASESFLPPTPKDAIPTESEVLAMDPATPDEPGSHLDLQGVIVFDNRMGVPQRIGVSVRGEKGVLHKNFVPAKSPFPFRLQDSYASEGYPFEGDEVELWVKVRYGTLESTSIEQTLKLPAKARGIIAVPAFVESPPLSPATKIRLVPAKLELRGTIHAPAEGTVERAEVWIRHGAGQYQQVLDGLPATLDLSGPELAEVPVYAFANTVNVTVFATTTDGQRLYATGDYPFQTADISLQPVVPPKPDPANLPREPVYGNTKGSRYDDGPNEKPAP